MRRDKHGAIDVVNEQGLDKPQYNLGLLYHHGRGVPQDYAEAMRWYRKAAEQGVALNGWNTRARVMPGDLALLSDIVCAQPFDIVMTQEDFDWWDDAVSQLDFVNYHTRLRADVTYPYQTEQHPGPDTTPVKVA